MVVHWRILISGRLKIQYSLRGQAVIDFMSSMVVSAKTILVFLIFVSFRFDFID